MAQNKQQTTTSNSSIAAPQFLTFPIPASHIFHSVTVSGSWDNFSHEFPLIESKKDRVFKIPVSQLPIQTKDEYRFRFTCKEYVNDSNSDNEDVIPTYTCNTTTSSLDISYTSQTSLPTVEVCGSWTKDHKQLQPLQQTEQDNQWKLHLDDIKPGTYTYSIVIPFVDTSNLYPTTVVNKKTLYAVTLLPSPKVRKLPPYLMPLLEAFLSIIIIVLLLVVGIKQTSKLGPRRAPTF